MVAYLHLQLNQIYIPVLEWKEGRGGKKKVRGENKKLIKGRKREINEMTEKIKYDGKHEGKKGMRYETG